MIYFYITTSQKYVSDFNAMVSITNSPMAFYTDSFERNSIVKQIYIPDIDVYIQNKNNDEIFICKKEENKIILHRLNGPARICRYGSIDKHRPRVLVEWYINGKNVTEKLVQWAKDNDIDLDNLSEENISFLKLIWGDYGK